MSAVMPAERGGRAFVLLAVQSINANGKSYAVQANTDSVIAGSPRARNLGAIAGGAAGNAIGDGSGRAAATVIGLIGASYLLGFQHDSGFFTEARLSGGGAFVPQLKLGVGWSVKMK